MSKHQNWCNAANKKEVKSRCINNYICWRSIFCNEARGELSKNSYENVYWSVFNSLIWFAIYFEISWKMNKSFWIPIKSVLVLHSPASWGKKLSWLFADWAPLKTSTCRSAWRQLSGIKKPPWFWMN